MFVHYRTQGIILKKEDRGEADQLFTIYTKDFGKLEILGKAIRKISSKLKSGTEVFYLSEIEFIQGKAHKTLTDAILIEKLANLRKSLKKLRIAYKIAEVSDSLIKGSEPDEKIWELILKTFARLNIPNLQSEIYNLQYYYFLWNFFSILGYQPELYNCSVCQSKIALGKIYFSPKEGGIICQICAKKIKNATEIQPEIIKLLRIILKKNWKLLSRIKIEPDYLKALESVSNSYLSYVSEIIE